MEFNEVSYLGSFSKVQDCPSSNMPEFAFIGRSNVGKSSLINALCSRKALAYTSSHPGKTQSINLYTIENSVILTDLPGYGYAKVSKSMRKAWLKMVNTYLLKREHLYCVMQLIDGSIPPQQADIDFTNWLGENQLPLAFVFTKMDKKKKIGSGPEAYLDKLKENWESMPPSYVVSSVKKTGLIQLREFLLSPK